MHLACSAMHHHHLDSGYLCGSGTLENGGDDADECAREGNEEEEGLGTAGGRGGVQRTYRLGIEWGILALLREAAMAKRGELTYVYACVLVLVTDPARAKGPAVERTAARAVTEATAWAGQRL
jgi:hypothetical protein